MVKNHPLEYILRKRKPNRLDEDFDLICAHFYFMGRFGHQIPVDDGREVWQHIKKLLTSKNTKEEKPSC